MRPHPSRREALSLLGGAAVASLLPSPARAQARPWNVLLLVSDEHSPHLPGPAGLPWLRTPNLDRLRREGVTCTRAYATSPICAPARAGLFTGLYPAESGVMSNGHSLDPRHRTLAHAFGAAGYQTSCVGKTHVNHPTATYGFDTWMSKDSPAFKLLFKPLRERMGLLPPPEDERALWEGIADRRLRGAPIEAPWTPFSQVVLDVLGQWLSAPSERPWFIHASWTEPHWAWNLPQDLYGIYDPASIPLPSAGPRELPPVPAGVRDRAGWSAMSEAQHRLCLARYAAAITYSDRVLGRILDMLDQSGQMDRTIVVYTTDHGDMAAEKRMWLKGFMYDAACGIPLTVRAPGLLPAGGACEALFSGADLLPTLCGLAGVPVPEGLSGRDQRAALRGEDPGPEHLYATLSGRPNNGMPGQLMVRDQRYKLIRYRADREAGQPELRELYDLEEDPGEERDLLRSRRGALRAERMAALGDAWLQKLRPSPYGLLKSPEQPEDLEDPNSDLPDD